MVLETAQPDIWPDGFRGREKQHRPPLPAGDAFFTWSRLLAGASLPPEAFN